MGHTRCDKPLTYIKINKAHNNAPLSTCSLRPGARTPVAPPRKGPTHKQNDAVTIWGSEEASLGHTWCDKSLTHTKQSNTHNLPTNTRLPTCSMRP